MYGMSLQEEPIEVRPALSAGGTTPPTDDNIVVEWISDEQWLFLLYAKAYVKSNPDDIVNKLVYQNLLNAYRSGY